MFTWMLTFHTTCGNCSLYGYSLSSTKGIWTFDGSILLVHCMIFRVWFIDALVCIEGLELT